MRCMTAQRSGAPLFPTYPSARKGAFILLITLVCYTQLCIARGRRFCVSCYNGPGNGLGWFLYFSVGSALKVGSAAHGRFPACGSPGTAGAAPPASWGRWGRGHGHWGLCCPISSGEETRSIPADGHRSPRCISCAGHIIPSPCHTVSPPSFMPSTHPESLQRSPASPYQALSIQTSPRVRQQAPGMGVSRKTLIICLLPPVFFHPSTLRFLRLFTMATAPSSCFRESLPWVALGSFVLRCWIASSLLKEFSRRSHLQHVGVLQAASLHFT